MESNSGRYLYVLSNDPLDYVVEGYGPKGLVVARLVDGLWRQLDCKEGIALVNGEGAQRIDGFVAVVQFEAALSALGLEWPNVPRDLDGSIESHEHFGTW